MKQCLLHGIECCYISGNDNYYFDSYLAMNFFNLESLDLQVEFIYA